MQDDLNATDEVDVNNTKAKVPKTNWNWAWGCISMVLACVVIYFAGRFFSGLMPVSNLRVKELPTWASLLEACGNSTDKWTIRYEPPTPKSPAYSPDGKWYITVGNAVYRDAEELRLYDAQSNRVVGSYSFYRLSLACWAKDSSGVYLQDWIPESFSSWSSNPKEVLVP